MGSLVADATPAEQRGHCSPGRASGPLGQPVSQPTGRRRREQNQEPPLEADDWETDGRHRFHHRRQPLDVLATGADA